MICILWLNLETPLFCDWTFCIVQHMSYFAMAHNLQIWLAAIIRLLKMIKTLSWYPKTNIKYPQLHHLTKLDSMIHFDSHNVIWPLLHDVNFCIQHLCCFKILLRVFLFSMKWGGKRIIFYSNMHTTLSQSVDFSMQWPVGGIPLCRWASITGTGTVVTLQWFIVRWDLPQRGCIIREWCPTDVSANHCTSVS